MNFCRPDLPKNFYEKRLIWQPLGWLILNTMPERKPSVNQWHHLQLQTVQISSVNMCRVWLMRKPAGELRCELKCLGSKQTIAMVLQRIIISQEVTQAHDHPPARGQSREIALSSSQNL